jgi:hypothetical protein
MLAIEFFNYATTMVIPFERIESPRSALKTLVPLEVKVIVTVPVASDVADSCPLFVAETTAFGMICPVEPSVILKVTEPPTFPEAGPWRASFRKYALLKASKAQRTSSLGKTCSWQPPTGAN